MEGDGELCLLSVIGESKAVRKNLAGRNLVLKYFYRG